MAGNNINPCKCDDGWSGEYCDVLKCDSKFCGLNGDCDTDGTKRWCNCHPGWDGAHCNEVSCKRITKCGQNGN